MSGSKEEPKERPRAEAKAEFARLCEQKIPPYSEASTTEFVIVYMPLVGLGCRDMFDVLESYKSDGWVVSLNHSGTGWWFSSREKLIADVQAVCLGDLEKLEARRGELHQMLDDLRDEDEAILMIRDERIDRINAGKLPIMGTPN